MTSRRKSKEKYDKYQADRAQLEKAVADAEKKLSAAKKRLARFDSERLNPHLACGWCSACLVGEERLCDGAPV